MIVYCYMTQPSSSARASVIIVHQASAQAAFPFLALHLSRHFPFFLAELIPGRLLKSRFAKSLLLHFLRERAQCFTELKIKIWALEVEQLFDF